jgi:hypothetical protein
LAALVRRPILALDGVGHRAIRALAHHRDRIIGSLAARSISI